MSGSPLPDFHPESQVRAVPVHALVEMRKPKAVYADSAGTILGLGKGALAEVRLPVFQRGLKWSPEQIKEFHDSLIQGWPIGVMVLATESSRLVNKRSGLRKFRMSLIDGQQRTYALSRLLEEFWSAPWYAYESPKWEDTGGGQGSIVDAGKSLETLAAALKKPKGDVRRAIGSMAAEQGAEAFEAYPEFLKALATRLSIPHSSLKKPANDAARKLTASLLQQHKDLQSLEVPVLLLDEALQPQLPSIFRRLNKGIPLKGYDLLAAIWEPVRLQTASTTATGRKFLKDVLDVARQRIRSTYSEAPASYDPNLEELEVEELSLFDLLYYLSRSIAPPPTFNISSDVLAFQVSATIFHGHINKVDDPLRNVFPVGADGGPDITVLPKLYAEAAKNVASALKPMMDVTSKNLVLRGRVGLTAAVVYIATFLTHHNRVIPASGERLALVRRGTSAEDRQVRPGKVMTASARAQQLKKTLPAWFVHDSLTSVFAGSRAYEAANDRVWKSFHSGTAKSRRLTLETSNLMLEHPPLDDLLEALRSLWLRELDVERTPQRRRVSDGGSILVRAAFSHLQVHDTVIDHVIPMSLGKTAASTSGDVYPLNHVANLMPLDEVVNNARKDEDWDTYFPRLDAATQKQVKAALLVPPDEATSAVLADIDDFVDFLAMRYRLLVVRALRNLRVDTWEGLRKRDRDRRLDDLVAE